MYVSAPGNTYVALNSLVWWLVTLPMAVGLKLDDHYGPLQSRPFYDSMIRENLNKILKNFH